MKRKRFELFPKEYGIFPFINLLYLLFPIINIASYHGVKMLLGYCLLILFFVINRKLYFTIGKAAFPYLLGLLMLLILPFSIFYGPYNLLLGYYPAGFFSWFDDKKKLKSWMMALVLVVIFCLLFNLGDMEVSSLLGIFPLVLVMFAMPLAVRSMMRSQELEQELDQANEQISELIKREERMRIARDLHDTLGHTLSLITLKSQLVEKLALKDQARAQSEAQEIKQISRSALRQVRELVTDMKAIKLSEELVQVRTIVQSAGITFHREGHVDFEEIPDLTQNILSMCLREAVTNIVKHSQATACTIHLEQLELNILMRVIDNGIGINKNESGNGLQGMAERLALIDGSMCTDSANGTELTFTVPFVVQEKEVAQDVTRPYS